MVYTVLGHNGLCFHFVVNSIEPNSDKPLLMDEIASFERSGMSGDGTDRGFRNLTVEINMRTNVTVTGAKCIESKDFHRFLRELWSDSF